VKAGLAAGEEASVESISDGHDFAEDGHRDLFRRLGPERQAHRAANT
jgi:hypothetical protein